MELALRENILKLEEFLIELPQLDIPVKHAFAHGLYVREIIIPKDSLVTGKIHLKSHVCIISRGDIAVTTDEGMRRITAPCIFIAQAGTKRCGYTFQETVWTTVHACDETEVDAAEEDLFVESFELYEEKRCRLYGPQ